MKEKPNSTRTYDKDGFRRRAACLCVRDGFETEILLVSSSSTPDRFIVPGGGLEPDEDAETAAIREVMEEAGVKGKIDRCLGIFEETSILKAHDSTIFSGDVLFQNVERRHRTQVFVLQVRELLEEWDDSKSIGRKRKWFTVADALEELAVSKPVQCNYVQLLANKTDSACCLPVAPESGEGATLSLRSSSGSGANASCGCTSGQTSNNNTSTNVLDDLAAESTTT
ncbi:diphosphoinositol polyphosphate phosphohydrolase 3-alpha-like isoform X1 [Varroa jacobsoni]|uniref:diphosphoinositol-polyphosphate diphosphatase n=1 Tax=Varroa destructor TaxID=109461 RepID=A0A7M7JU48_VARDE|nr:diphosphoinositol polyphosphate phosphohydrolase 3-alpha-like isoform X1 [Varroa destructor]XP_022657153.1 diphosphoinositol polyphosphate phosphohydrolase 3-alpha-like isoform X1 [Varroa destructor]XP_022705775.1 diphosphoinositol polyphosphate phosphohydrolase 3-alpha-like isoform X1 [Varroa jacobsoni]